MGDGVRSVLAACLAVGAMNGVHIHAPQPTEVWARSDQNCPARARDGRRCGGRRMLVKYTPWYGINATCYHCGARYGEDGIQHGRGPVETVRRQWLDLDGAGKNAPVTP